VWNGFDVYGRLVQGTVAANINIGYVYDGYYGIPVSVEQSFAIPSGIKWLNLGVARDAIKRWQRYSKNLSNDRWFADGQGIGGWTLSPHHAYDPSGLTLYMGDGKKIHASNYNQMIHRIVGTGNNAGGYGFYGDGGPALEAELQQPQGVATAPDGSVYLSDMNQIIKITPDGIIHLFGGDQGGGPDFYGDGGPALNAYFDFPMGLDLDPDGSLFIADFNNNRIRKIDPDGIVSTVAGSESVGGMAGDGGPATAAQLYSPTDVIVAPDGALFIADSNNNRIRRVGVNGIITTYAGNGNGASSGDNGPAMDAGLNHPRSIALGPDGSLYIAEYDGNVIRRVYPDGIIVTYAGTGNLDSTGDGGPATDADIAGPAFLSVEARGGFTGPPSTGGRYRYGPVAGTGLGPGATPDRRSRHFAYR
jgi:sugar lactone lactonase YvrE